jgi:hypothetical protein
MTTQKIFTQLCREFKLPEPVAEFQFAADIKRRWRIDYYFEQGEKKIALEVEGGVWIRGRHTRPKGFIADMEKYNEMTRRGIGLVRVQPKDLLKISTMRLLQAALSN